MCKEYAVHLLYLAFLPFLIFGEGLPVVVVVVVEILYLGGHELT